MTRLTLGLVSLLALIACGGIVRDGKVYRTELDFLEQVAMQPTNQLGTFVAATCTCTDGKFIAPVGSILQAEDCEKAAKTILIVKARVPWHKAMMLFNAGLIKDRPPRDPPAVPATSTMCSRHFKSTVLPAATRPTMEVAK